MYSELHLHTCYSFLEGASLPEELVARAAELGYSALAVTDHDGLYGAMEFAQACSAADIQPITGVELTLQHGLVDRKSGPVHLTLLAENARGYANLCRLITEAHRGTRPWDRLRNEPTARHSPLATRHSPSLPLSALQGHTEGLIALTGCRSGELARLVDAERFDDALEAARRLMELFGADSTFVELQHNLVRGDTARLARLAELAERLGLPLVTTGNVHYHERARHRLQDALVAIKHRGTLDASHRLRRPNSEFFLRSPHEAAEVFAAYPQAVASTMAIAERCSAFNLADHRQIGYEFPDFARKPHEQHLSADEALAAYCWKRFEERYPTRHSPLATRHSARAQLEEELRLVAKHRLAGFFLIYRDLQELATEVAREVRGKGSVRGGSGLPPGRGRGSSVSSIICYLIGLSHVDPVKNRLFFHRFLNEDLQAVPDIDLDFARDIREQLIIRVYERYGHDHAALVCSFATYHLRSAVRDLGKVLGLPAAAIDKLARLSEGGRASTVGTELERLGEATGRSTSLVRNEPTASHSPLATRHSPLWQHLIELAAQLDGFPRHVSQHVGGMIISSRPLVEVVPIQPAAMEGRYICQWDKDSCDDARFIKIDFLALGMLSLVEECLELVWQYRGEKVDFGALTYDAPAVYDTICRGDTVGFFQVESRAQIQMLPRTRPRNLDDLAVQVAIVRPGPIVGGAVNPYVRRRELLRQDPAYQARADHPRLNELLADTLGIVLYQDQVLEVAIAIGGFTPGQADQFRRAMTRRRSHDLMESFRQSFVQGALERDVTRRQAEAIFDKLSAFSAFGFPKSHAYAFAVLAYQSAWLRHRYPAEYYAALLNNQPMGFYSPHVLIGDAKRHGLQVLRVSVNRSGVKCLPGSVLPLPLGEGRGEGREPGLLLLGLTTVQGISEEVARTIIAEREARGPYRSLSDLLNRTGLSRHAAENLIAVGALSDLGLSRRELLWQLGLLTDLPLATRHSPLATRQLPLPLPTEQDMVELPDMDDWDRMIADYRLLKLSPSYHPLELLRPHLPADIRTAADLKELPDDSYVRTAGMVVCRQRPGTAKGFVFLLLEDETGLTNVVIRPDLYEADRLMVRGAPYLWAEGVVQNRSGSLNLLVERLGPLARVPTQLLPRPAMRHPYPGTAYDPREEAAREGNNGGNGSNLAARRPLPRYQRLQLATPPSHDFH